MSLPLVAIVGRPNVGKSTLFNRLVGRPLAIVADRPGTTRDRAYAPLSLEEREVILVDTGGLEVAPTTDMGQKVKAQVELALQEADIILFLADAKEGLLQPDRDIAQTLRRSGKKTLLVVNKADNETRALDALQFYELALGDPIPVSAHHGRGLEDLLDRLADLLPPSEPETRPSGIPLAIVGRPNVGKSLLVNALLGQERAIVSPEPGTTRDALDSFLVYDGQPVILIDTAGLRRRGRIEGGVEHYSVLRALRAINRAEVALLVLEATEPAMAQDAHIIGYILDSYKGLVLLVNKWDLVSPQEQDEEQCSRFIRARLPFLPWAPILFISALKGWGLEKVLPAALQVAAARSQRLPTAEVNRVVAAAIADHAPPSRMGRRLNILYATQAEAHPPTFVFFVNDPKLLHFSYRRYLENRLREAFGFGGTAIKLVFKGKKEAWQPSASSS